ncbi:related to RNA-dependent RNA polymerase SAD-1 [Rhynchosporium graminicola]|uniref:RNA-dependent RNA polymerase n=1 Tax=Rhynchosporium graminicola TaxID=2792576 RepID=A0A1E1L5R4_9HELO|nr:related to RNA-dependent RNA polymerase SAD-1 [Rhynchosporium commune]
MSQGFRARMDPTQVVRRPRNPVLQDQQRQGAILKPSYEWQQWDELTIKLRGLAPHETTYNLWTTFRDYGTISFIEIFEGNGGNRDGGAKIRFSPPPEIPIWKNSPHNIKSEGNAGETYMVQLTLLDDRRQSRTVQSPIRHTKFYPPKMKMVPSAIHFGLMVNPWSMMPLHTHIPTSSAHNDTTLVVDLKKHRLVASFTVKFENPGHNPSYDRINQYQFHIPFSQLTKIKKLELNDAAFALIISVESPPMYYRKRESKEAGHSRENLMWSEWDTWYRQTDIVYDPYVLQKETITLHKDQPVIDIGRWTTFLFEFAHANNMAALYAEIKQALQDFNVEIEPVPRLIKIPPQPAELWSLIDPPVLQNASADLASMQGGNDTFNLPWEIRYQLEVCISREYINEYNIDKQFIQKLGNIAAQDQVKARDILEYVANEMGTRLHEPLRLFDNPKALGHTSKVTIPHYCAYSRKATVTPSTMYLSSPTVETTNRVLRHYSREHQDGRFLRVQFTDELAEGRINSCADKQRNDELFTRVYRTLYNGIQIGDRRFKFLAFGNSQFRENGAYFFCETDHLSCANIRKWMGDFGHIQVVAKYAARLGQCFSTTRAIRSLPSVKIIEIADVENNGFTFTDGVGKIGPYMASMITAELQLCTITAPSAFQFRLGGCKGILIVWPEILQGEVHIRQSQQKFQATYQGLEIIRCARFSCASLNRQTITILSSLGVADDVFLDMLAEQLANYQTAMSNDDVAVSLLLRYIDDNSMTINLATMIRNGFMTSRDPFVLSLLHLWRSWSIKMLKEKAKIIVENGAFVLGCVDETKTLRGYTHPRAAYGEQLAEDELPQIFIQVPDKKDPNHYNVIEGICLVGRNPSLHPGDLRVVEAVNVPALHHLRDVVVFPIQGDRDVPSMCSGGDLDGDDFFIIWDKNLRPPEWNCEPLNYDAPAAKTLHRPVEITDLMKFFVRFMKNDALPTIAHAHLANSDFLPNGVKDPKCLKLAALHSKAVDYVKTGEPAEMPKDLRARKWPHFMEKKFKPREAIYQSDKILGLLYDKVETVNFTPRYNEPFDRRILNAYTLDDATLKAARQVKTKYDIHMKRIMAQQEIKTEFEIWSTFVLSKPRVGTDYKLHEEVGRLSEALKHQFRLECIARAGSDSFSDLGPFVAAMYKVTKEELDIALAECRPTGFQAPRRKMEPKYMPFISFPWLFEREMGRIATGVDTSEDLEALGLPSLVLREPGQSRRPQGGGEAAQDDHVERQDGRVIHRGEELALFEKSDFEDHADDSDYDEARETRDEHWFTRGTSGEAVLATDFELGNSSLPDYMRQGTGVEDVVPQAPMDGLIDPRESARNAHSNATSISPLMGTLVRPQASVGQSGHARIDSRNHNSTHEASDISTSDPAPVGNGRTGSPSSALDDLAELMYTFKPDVEEEFVQLEIKESPLERVERLLGSGLALQDPVIITDQNETSVAEEEVEEIEVHVDVQESTMDRLNRLMSS